MNDAAWYSLGQLVGGAVMIGLLFGLWKLITRPKKR